MTVEKYMSKNVITVSPQATLAEAIKMLLKDNIKSLPVVDEGGKLLGIISRRRILSDAPESLSCLQNDMVCDIMELDVQTVGPGESIQTAVKLMTDLSISRLPVVEKGKVVGIISRDNVLSYYVQNLEEKGHNHVG